MYWDAMNGVSQYELQYCANSSFTNDVYSKIVNGTNTTVNTSTSIEPIYIVRVRSICSESLKSDWSEYKDFNVDGTPTSSARTNNQNTQINSDNSNEALKSASTTNSNGNLTNSISASPNPFKEYLNVRYNVLGNEPNYYTIIDLLGRQVYESKHQVSEKGTLLDENFDSTALPNGVYVLITHNGSFATNFTRVIKQ